MLCVLFFTLWCFCARRSKVSGVDEGDAEERRSLNIFATPFEI